MDLHVNLMAYSYLPCTTSTARRNSMASVAGNCRQYIICHGQSQKNFERMSEFIVGNIPHTGRKILVDSTTRSVLPLLTDAQEIEITNST